MAQEDLEDMVAIEKPVVTAADNLEGYGQPINDVLNAQAAAAAGVKRASFINYDVALDAYAARDDIEDLAHKNARNAPEDFAQASFMRTDDGAVGSGSSA